MNRMKYYILFLFMIVSSALFSQYDTLSGRFIHYGINDGLRSNSIVSITQDNHGFIWTGTSDGLYKFDGFSFQEIMLDITSSTSFISIRKIDFDPKSNKIVVGTYQGLYIIDPSNLSIQQIASLNVKDFAIKDQKIYYTGFDINDSKYSIISVYALQQDHNQTYKTVARSNAIAYHEDQIYFGTDTLFSFDTINSKYIPIRFNGVDNSNLDIQDIVVLENKIIVASWGKGIIVHDLNSSLTTSHQFSIAGNGERYNGVRHLNMKDKNTIYISTADRGPGIFDLNSKSFSFYIHDKTDPSSITEISARSTFIDRANNLWVAMAESLSLLSSDQNFIYYDQYPLSKYNVQSRDLYSQQLTNYKDEFICQCQKNFGQLMTYSLSGNPLEINWKYPEDHQFDCYGFANFGDDLITHSYSHIYRINPKTKQISILAKAEDIPSTRNNVRFHDMVVYHDTLFLRGWNELYTYKINIDQSTIEYLYTEPFQKSNQFIVVNNQLYISDPKNLYRRIGKENYKRIDLVSDSLYTTDSDPMYLSISEDRYLLISTIYDGLGIYDTVTDSLIIHNQSTGLPSNHVSRAIGDGNGNIWMLSSSGLLNYNKKYHTYSLFTENDGAFSTDLLPDQIFKLKDNLLGISIDHGVNLIDLSKVDFQQTVDPISIFDINGISPEKLTPFDPSISEFNVRFSNFTYGDTKDYSFEYAINDQGWQPIRNNGHLTLLVTNPGISTVKIRGQDALGRKMEEDQIRFRVKARWYQTLWFKIGIIGFALALGSFIFYLIQSRRRIATDIENQYKILTQELENQVLRSQMNPHFLFNCLNSIRFFILNQESDKAANYLTKFSRLIRLILENSRKNLVPLQSELEMIDLYIKLEQLRFDHKFQFIQHIDPAIDSNIELIPPMLIQPFLENAILHGINPKEGSAYIKLTVEKTETNALKITIEDDGIGRQKSSELKAGKSIHKESLGMNITQKRLQVIAHNLNTDILIRDMLPGTEYPGTVVTFTIKK